MRLFTQRVLFLVVVLMLALALPGKSQIQLGGLADFELRKGGTDSSPYVNQTPTDKWTIYTPYIRIFANANISENWYLTSALQSDYYYGSGMSYPFFSVLNINWLPINDSDFTVTAGRFITPYGAYSQRVLSSENPFVHLPLSHSSGLPVTQESGLHSSYLYYDEGETGLTMIYQRMYSQGIMLNNQVGESGWLRYSLAATLSPASGYFDTAQYNTPAFTGRLTLQPKVWARFGFSFSSGAFMLNNFDQPTLPNADPSSYRQTLLGTDVMISYRYYTFLVEYNWSRWNAPYIDGGGMVVSDDQKASASHISGEAVVNFPFFVGGYGGIRYEQIISGDVNTGSGAYGSAGENWTYDRGRLEMLLGYKLHRNITLKASYLYSTDTGPDLDDDVLAIQLSVAY